MSSRCFDCLLLSATLLFCWSSSQVAFGVDWPQWRGEDRANKSPETGINTDWANQPPQLLWHVEGMGEGYASVSVVDGHAFTTGDFEEGQGVVAVDTRDGSVVWQKTLTDGVPSHGYEGSRCTPTVDGNRLYVVLSDGTVACLSTDQGDVIWRRHFVEDWQGRMMSGWGFSESPLVDGDRLICTPGAEDAMLVALDKHTGEEIWRSAIPDLGENGRDGAAYSSVVISHAAGQKQYVQLVGRGVIGVRAEDGQFLWGYNRIANRVASIPTPLVRDNLVFCSTGYGTGAALLQLTGDGNDVSVEEEYFLRGATFQNHHGGMVLLEGHVYAGHAHNQGFPTCVELATGEIAWGGRLRGPGNGSAAVTCVDGHLIFRYQSGEVALIEATPTEYRLKGTFVPAHVESPSWAHPVVAGGRLYLREQNQLMCYDLSPGAGS